MLHGSNLLPGSNHQIGLKATISAVSDLEMANLEWRRKKAQSSHGPRIIGKNNRSPHPINILQSSRNEINDDPISLAFELNHPMIISAGDSKTIELIQNTRNHHQQSLYRSYLNGQSSRGGTSASATIDIANVIGEK